MCFDVPKIVRSTECDHGHDEESRNGRDMKIDILDDYIRTPEWFQGLLDVYRSTGGLLEPPGGLMGLMGPKWSRGGAARAGRVPPPPLVRIGQGGGRPPPFPSSPLSPSFPSPTWTRKGGSPTPGGSRTPPGAPPPGQPHLPLAPLYTGQGAP